MSQNFQKYLILACMRSIYRINKGSQAPQLKEQCELSYLLQHHSRVGLPHLLNNLSNEGAQPIFFLAANVMRVLDVMPQSDVEILRNFHHIWGQKCFFSCS